MSENPVPVDPLAPEIAATNGVDPVGAVRADDAVVIADQRPRTSPADVEAAIDAFLVGVAANVDFDPRRSKPWRARVQAEMEEIDWTSEQSRARAMALLEQLKREFVATVVAPDRYASLLRLWLFTLAGMLAVALIIGNGGLLSWCMGPTGSDEGLCGSLYGHFVGYISFRYVVYGVLMGNALRLSYTRSRATFDGTSIETNLLNRPVLNIILGTTVAYLLATLVASGGLELSVFGFAIKQSMNEAHQVGFRDAAALLLVGITASIASDIYVQRLIDGARRTANDFLARDSKG